MSETYDKLTGICLVRELSKGTSEGGQSDPPSINGVLTEDLFALVVRHCSVPQRAQLASVCKLWNSFIKRGWKSITLQDPHLARQLTWLRKLDQDILQELTIRGSRYPPGAISMLQLDMLPCITRFSRLKRIELELDGRFHVSLSFLNQLSVLDKLESLTASCTVPDSNEAIDLSELSVLTNLKDLDLSFTQHQARINLSVDLSALTTLTFLQLKGLHSLQQQEGCGAGALCSLLGHLQHLDVQVQEDLEMELLAPTLTYLRFCCGTLRSTYPAVCPKLLFLEFEAPPLRAEHMMGMTALTNLTMGFGNKVSPSAVRALHCCRQLSYLQIGEYFCGVEDSDTFEEFSMLTGLRSLDLAFTTHSRRYSISPKLSRLQFLRTLHLMAKPQHTFSGGLNHLPSLSSATISGSYHGPPLHSASLVRLEIQGFEGYGFEPEEVLPLGSLPMLTSLTMLDALEAHMSRFVCLESLSSLQEVVVHLSYTAASDPIPTFQPADDTDVTCLLASLPALPALQTVEIQAMRRGVVLEQVGKAHYKHLSLACAYLCIPPAEAAALADLKSVHLVFEDGHPDTLDLLAQLGASQKTLPAGDLYMCRELRDVRLGCMTASSGMSNVQQSLKTVYDDGFFL